jgi:hypothetical protein
MQYPNATVHAGAWAPERHAPKVDDEGADTGEERRSS